MNHAVIFSNSLEMRITIEGHLNVIQPPPRANRQERLSESHRILLPDDFHERALAPVAVEFAVENLFPRAKIQFSFGNGDNDFQEPQCRQ